MRDIITEISDKAAHFMGLELSSERVNAKHKQKLIEDSTQGGLDLNSLMEYRYFDDQSELFFLEDNICGFMLESSLVVGVDEGMIKNLTYFINNEIPFGGSLHFMLLASNDVEHVINKWQKARSNPHPFLQKVAKHRVDFIRDMASNFVNYDGRIVRDYRLYISFSKKCGDTLKKTRVSKDDVDQIVAFKKHLLGKLSALSMPARGCNDKDLLRVIREIFEFKFDGTCNYKSNNPYATLNNQIFESGNNFVLSKDELTNVNTDIATRCYEIQGLPKGGNLAQTIELLGSSENLNLGIKGRFIISYTISNIHKNKELFAVRGDRVRHAAEQFYAKGKRDLQRDAYQWSDIIDKAKGGENYLLEQFTVILSTKVDSIDNAENGLQSLYRVNDYELKRSDMVHMPIILGSLPMQQASYLKPMQLMKLTRTAMGSEVVAKLPINGEWKGVPVPGLILFGRRGQIFEWNSQYRISSGNPNVTVIGPSGGGKSVFLQSYVDSLVATGTRAFILDIGASFAELGKLLGGEIIQFGKKVELSLNPFESFFPDIDRDEFYDMVRCAKELLSIMCGANDDLGKAELEKAIIAAVQENNYQININDFVKYLENSSSTKLQTYGRTLYSYTSNGIYGKYFSGAKSASFKKDITIFEFEEIKKDKKLLAIILQVLLMEITTQFFTGDRTKNFVVIIDEAWMLLDYCASFIAELCRVVRKYGGAIITCVQNYHDLQKSPDHRAILENSTWTVLLKQDEKGLEAFKESEAFKDKIPLIKSINLVPDKYSEMLLYATGVCIVGRLMLDDYSKALYSTDSKDFAYLRQAEAKGIKLEDALEQLVKLKRAG